MLCWYWFVVVLVDGLDCLLFRLGNFRVGIVRVCVMCGLVRVRLWVLCRLVEIVVIVGFLVYPDTIFSRSAYQYQPIYPPQSPPSPLQHTSPHYPPHISNIHSQHPTWSPSIYTNNFIAVILTYYQFVALISLFTFVIVLISYVICCSIYALICLICLMCLMCLGCA